MCHLCAGICVGSVCVCVVRLPVFLCVSALCARIVSVCICLHARTHVLVWGCVRAGRRVRLLPGMREHVCLRAGGGLGPWPGWRVCTWAPQQGEDGRTPRREKGLQGCRAVLGARLGPASLGAPS